MASPELFIEIPELASRERVACSGLQSHNKAGRDWVPEGISEPSCVFGHWIGRSVSDLAVRIIVRKLGV
jgi:hypothetical protein